MFPPKKPMFGASSPDPMYNGPAASPDQSLEARVAKLEKAVAALQAEDQQEQKPAMPMAAGQMKSSKPAGGGFFGG